MNNPQIVQPASNAGFDALFLSIWNIRPLSIQDASTLCIAGLQTGITPFVRVPYQCGNGFVQRVLDGGAMGVVFPHIHNKSEWDQAPVRCVSFGIVIVWLNNIISSEDAQYGSIDLQNTHQAG